MDKLEERLRKLGRVIYIAVAEDVADDISKTVTEAADEITRLNAEVERLTKEADDHAEAANRWRNEWGEAQALIDEMVEGLEPFAALPVKDGLPDEKPVLDFMGDGDPGSPLYRWTVGDFRRARALILKARGKDANAG